MRLTCPTCDAEYEITDTMVPVAGRHVQCTACHTRWFVRAEAPKQESEDEIMRRLEARSHLRAVPRAERAAPDAPPAASPPADVVAPLRTEKTAPAPSARPVPARANPATASPEAVPAKPAHRPMAVSDGVTLRPAPRIDLGAEPVSADPAEAPPGRFGQGVLVALVLFVIALGGYVWRGELARSVPVAAPALDVYGRTVDGLRMELDGQFQRFRGGGAAG